MNAGDLPFTIERASSMTRWEKQQRQWRFVAQTLLILFGTTTSNPLAVDGLERTMMQPRRMPSGTIIDGSVSIHFDQCYSMAVQEPPDSVMANPDLAVFVERREIQAQTSVVQFRACPRDYARRDDCWTFMTDLHSYLYSLMEQPTDELLAYCQICQASGNVCDKNNNRNRNLDASLSIPSDSKSQENNRMLGVELDDMVSPFQYVDCNECATKGCFDNSYHAQIVSDNAVVEWMESMMACQPLPKGILWMGEYSLYASFMCNQDGTGAEVAIFLDPQCMIYTSSVSFAELMKDLDLVRNQDERDLIFEPAKYSTNLVTRPFQDKSTCAAVTYSTPIHNDPPVEYDDQQEPVTTMPTFEDSHELWEMNVYCESLLTSSYDVDSCEGEDSPILLDGSSSPDGPEQATATNQQGKDYLLTLSEAQDPKSVCGMIANADPNAIALNPDLWRVYQETNLYGTGSASLYNYDSKKQQQGPPQNLSTSEQKIDRQIHALETTVIVLSVLVFVVLVANAANSFWWRPRSRNGHQSLKESARRNRSNQGSNTEVDEASIVNSHMGMIT